MKIQKKISNIVGILFIIAGCNDNIREPKNEYCGGSQNYLCTPGEQEECTCDNGDQGYQSCNDDGTSFNACTCKNYANKCDEFNEFLGKGINETHCYRYHLLSLPTYETSTYECRIWGGELVAVNSQEEFNFIVNYLYSPPPGQNYIHESGIWIGAIDKYPYTGNVVNYTWSNGDLWGVDDWGMSAGVFPWNSGNPEIDKPCTALFYDGFESKTCTMHDDVLGYICEKQL